MRRSLPAHLVVSVVAAFLPAVSGVTASAQPAGQYRVFWVDTFNTNLSDHGDVISVVTKAKAARANALFAPRGSPGASSETE